MDPDNRGSKEDNFLDITWNSMTPTNCNYFLSPCHASKSVLLFDTNSLLEWITHTSLIQLPHTLLFYILEIIFRDKVYNLKIKGSDNMSSVAK